MGLILPLTHAPNDSVWQIQYQNGSSRDAVVGLSSDANSGLRHVYDDARTGGSDNDDGEGCGCGDETGSDESYGHAVFLHNDPDDDVVDEPCLNLVMRSSMPSQSSLFSIVFALP